MQNVIGVREQLTSFEREQVRVTRPRTDQRDPAGAGGARLGDGNGQVSGVVGAAAPEQTSRLRVDDPAIDTRLLWDRHAALAELPPHIADQSGKRSPLAPQPALDPGAQRRGEEGALARSGDGDEQRVAPNDRGRDEAALRRAVDDVDQDAGFLRLLPAAPVDLCVFAGIDDETGAGEIARPVIA